MALANAARPASREWMHVEKRALSEVQAPAKARPAWWSPIRPMASASARSRVCRRCTPSSASVLRERFQGWQAAMLTGNPPLARNLGIYAKRTHRLFNGTHRMPAAALRLERGERPRPAEEVRADWSQRPGAQMFANRLRKNLQRLDPGRQREHIDCFRVYDADMPEYAFAIDLYGRDARHVYVQEYAPPKSVNRGKCARAPPRSAGGAAGSVGGAAGADAFARAQAAERRASSTRKRESARGTLAVQEGGLKFWVNFRDYLDTGLFLDHRLVRGMLRDWAKDADFLNLFCYTGSATVYAAAGGARSTTSVDLSNTYLDWAHDNLLLNGFRRRQPRAVSRRLPGLARGAGSPGPRFDLIFLDPPTFSNSKRMEGVLDVQRDHVGMIRRSLKLLRPAGGWCFRPTTAASNWTRRRSRILRSKI